VINEWRHSISLCNEKGLLLCKICLCPGLRVDFVPLSENGEITHERNGHLAAERIHSKPAKARSNYGGDPPFLCRPRRPGGGNAVHESGDGHGYSSGPV